MAEPRVETWRQPDGYWRWRYVHPASGGQVTVTSNLEYDARDRARESAANAYPGVPIRDLPSRDAPSPPALRRALRRLRRLTELTLYAVILTGCARRLLRGGPPSRHVRDEAAR